jgi:UDP-N-acetylmuramoylalanine--D-glutamate ligase
MKVTVMGLGLHGGGAASARFFATGGADVTVTDLRSGEELAPSIEKLSDLPLRYVLGRHETGDFTEADLVVKNPAVPAHSPYLKHAKRVETDLSVFLSINERPVIAITGSKGKSTTASAAAAALESSFPGTRLGGNITISPLLFLEDPSFTGKKYSGHPVVLEISSWQLGDLKDKGVLKPQIACITTILPDHLDHYSSMEDYIKDKSYIYREQTKDHVTLLNYDDPVTPRFASETRGKIIYFSGSPLSADAMGGWLDENNGRFRNRDGTVEKILPSELSLPGNHNRKNLLCAACICRLFGMGPEKIAARLAHFRGIEHRLEPLGDKGGVTYINDSAATIPEATVEAAASFSRPVILIAGGTDKNLHFEVFSDLPANIKQFVLLKGSATEKMVDYFRQNGVSQFTLCNTLEEAVTAAASAARPNDIVLFSPGCASFELFRNEFDRGNQFKTIVKNLQKK